jgi:hypothetical protein
VQSARRHARPTKLSVPPSLQPTDALDRIKLFKTDPRKFGPCVLKLKLKLKLFTTCAGKLD